MRNLVNHQNFQVFVMSLQTVATWIIFSAKAGR